MAYCMPYSMIVDIDRTEQSAGEGSVETVKSFFEILDFGHFYFFDEREVRRMKSHRHSPKVYLKFFVVRVHAACACNANA